MKTSCIRYPENNRYIQLHEWQLRFCEGNHCAGLLLSFFINWHEWKLKNDHYYHKANHIAELHGDGRPHNENAYLFFSMEELIEGTMNFYGKNAINQALQLLVSLNVLTIHQNPNPRYHFDKTKYFQLNPTICNRWISENYPVEPSSSINNTQAIDYSDQPKQDDRMTEKGLRSAEMGRPSDEKGKAITNTTNHTTTKNQSIKTRDDFLDKPEQSGTQNEESRKQTQVVMKALLQQGFSEKHFGYPDTENTIQSLLEAGATVEIFLEAHTKATRISKRGFGVNYLAKVVVDLLNGKKSKSSSHLPFSTHTERIPDYQPDYSGGLDWMGDLID